MALYATPAKRISTAKSIHGSEKPINQLKLLPKSYLNNSEAIKRISIFLLNF